MVHIEPLVLVHLVLQSSLESLAFFSCPYVSPFLFSDCNLQAEVNYMWSNMSQSCGHDIFQYM